MEVETSRAPAPQGTSVGFRARGVLSGAVRGVVGAMAMTGMRVMTTELGLVEQTPPRALSRQRARGLRALLRRAPRTQRRGLVEAAHWAFGAVGGAAFGVLPRAVRDRPWVGPVYGLVVWLGFGPAERLWCQSSRPSRRPGSAAQWSSHNPLGRWEVVRRVVEDDENVRSRPCGSGRGAGTRRLPRTVCRDVTGHNE